MSSDLLPNFRESAGISHGDVAVDLPPEYPKADEAETEVGGGLDEFYEYVVRVNQELQSMKKLTEELNGVHNEMHCSTDDQTKRNLRETAQSLHDRINKDSTSIKEHLDEMQKLTAKRKEKASEHPAEIRIQENQHMLLRQEFVTALTNLQQVEQTNKDKYKETLKRRIKTKFSHQQLQDEEVEKMAQQVIEKGEESSIFSSTKMSIATTTLEEVVEMRRDIHDIEVALKNLHQIFMDMAVLVAEQGEMLNNISENVGKATNYVFEGRVQIKKARDHQKKSRKRMCYLFICLVILVVAGLIVGIAVLK
eukprot:TRINITY_DN3256_c0_g2_i1.p1 TRINITY_DN3256_c0_g2~~TRINITY_DN3256_c0_g2_i1.p1  ORF type:complete len:308 (+),score=130.69 TRINITY_DN3256_c0_g2_i1:49-972(+)